MKNTYYANFANNIGMMNAYYAPIRGNARKGGYTRCFHGHYNRNSGERNNSFTGRGLFFNCHPKSLPPGFGNIGNNQGRG